MLLLLLTAVIAHAEPPGEPVAKATSGTWSFASDADAYQAAAKASVEASIAEINFAFRAIARKKLMDLAPACTEYRFDLTAESFSYTCVGHPPVVAPLDGSGATYEKWDGEVVPLQLRTTKDTVIIDFNGEDGGQLTTFRFTGETVELRREITSQYFSKSVVYDATYRR